MPSLRRAWLLPWVGLLLCGGLALWAFEESREPPRHHLPRFQALVNAGGGPAGAGSAGRVADDPIRVLFYGQSITRQDWWQGVSRHLQQRFPSRRFEFHNLAVGGHDAARLVRMVEADVLPLQPDLVIFHVYGQPAELRRTLQQIRAGTSADVLLANDHIVRDGESFEETSDLWLVESGTLRRLMAGLRLIGANSDWQAWRNQEFLPDVSHELGIAMADVRRGWARELRTSGRPASDYLADDIHLNARGVALMERLVIEALDEHLQVAVPGSAPPPLAVSREIVVGPSCVEPVQMRGHRIDVAGPPGLALRLRLDGRAPAAHPDLIEIGRASELPGTQFPALLRVGRVAAAQEPVGQGQGGAATEAVAAAIGRHALSLGRRDAQGHYEVTWRLEGGGASLQGTTGSDLRWDAAGLVIAAQDWNTAYAEQVFGVGSFTGAEMFFEVRAPAPVLALTGPAPVTALRLPRNGLHRLCLETVDGRSERIRLIEHRAAYDCGSPSAACTPAAQP